MGPRFLGVPGAIPRPFLSHRFLWERKRCPGRAGPLREGGILYERATTGRPYGRRAESSRPTDSGGWAGIREPLIRPGVRTGEGRRRVRDAAPHNIPSQKEFLFYNSICCAEAEFLV